MPVLTLYLKTGRQFVLLVPSIVMGNAPDGFRFLEVSWFSGGVGIMWRPS